MTEYQITDLAHIRYILWAGNQQPTEKDRLVQITKGVQLFIQSYWTKNEGKFLADIDFSKQ